MMWRFEGHTAQTEGTAWGVTNPQSSRVAKVRRVAGSSDTALKPRPRLGGDAPARLAGLPLGLGHQGPGPDQVVGPAPVAPQALRLDSMPVLLTPSALAG